MDCTGLSVLFALVTTSLAFPSEHTFKRLPKMVVFDSDFTLWPFWLENSVNGPYHQNSTGQIVDSSGHLITYFPEVPKVFQYLKDHKILIAIFSPCFNVESTKTIINLFKWKDQFDTAILYPYGEYIPFDKLEEKSKISLEDMLFFDDQIFHYQDIMKNTKIALQQVKEGATMQILMDGLKKFSDMKTSKV